VFGYKFGKGTMLYIGYDYNELSEPWVKALIAGMQERDLIEVGGGEGGFGEGGRFVGLHCVDLDTL
jgi:hypothetical protein